MASLNNAFEGLLGSMNNNGSSNFNPIIQHNIQPIPTMSQAAQIIADQHRFHVGQLVSKYPPNIRTDDGCYHFVNKVNGYDYCYKYT